MSPIQPKMMEEEAVHLAWIHSNKFTTAELFHRKFLGDQTYRNACHLLRRYYDPKVGFLHVVRGNPFEPACYSLTVPSLKALDAEGKILVRNVRFAAKINPYEKKHDLAVQAIRIALESNADLKNIFWVSDFEMRSGITGPIKLAFQEKELDVERWRSDWLNIHIKGRRTPDGYFEADLDGKRYGFALEFEHHPYSERMVNRMVGYLDESFPDAIRLVVSAETKNAIRMIKALRAKIRESDQYRWFVSGIEKATTLPFKKIWHQLDHPIE